jgi:hypothetical protein
MNEIFIFAQTRSGSTLLQRAINQNPGVLIYGEHGGMLSGYARAYYGSDLQCLAKHSRFEPEKLRDLNGFVPCQSCITVGNLRGNMRDFVEATFNPSHSRRWGFKEVRYGRGQVAFDHPVVDLLIELFPSCKFVLLIRDPREQIASQIGMGWSPANAAFYDWHKQFEFYSRLRQEHQDRCRFYHYEQLRDASRMFAWLELDCPQKNLFELPVTGATPSKSPITEVLAKNIEEVLMPTFQNQQYD